MKKFLGVSVITASLLVSTVFGADEMLPQIPISGMVTKDKNTNKAKDIEYKIELVKGWNLIGLPGYKPYILKDFFGKKEMVEKIFVFNSKVQEWQSFVTEGEDQNVKTILPGMGYWINVKVPFSISFKSNIPGQRGVYEKAAVNMPKDLKVAAENTSNDMPPSVPIMINSAGGYDDSFDEKDGSVKEEFLQKNGTADWDNLNPEDYSEADWNAEFTFDMDLLDGTEYTDQVGRKYQFSSLNERGGKVVILDGDKTITAKFEINRKGELEIQLKKKPDNGENPQDGEANPNGQPDGNQPVARVVGAEPAEDGEVAVTAISVEPNNGIGDGAKPMPINANKPEPKAPPVLHFELIEIEDGDNGVVLKLKNIESKQPAKWILTSFYDEIDAVWEDATAYFAENVVDDELAGVDWESLTEDDSDLSDVLDSEDVTSYDEDELSEEFNDDEEATNESTTEETIDEV